MFLPSCFSCVIIVKSGWPLPWNLLDTPELPFVLKILLENVKTPGSQMFEIQCTFDS